MMSLRDQILDDVHEVFLNEGDFAERITLHTTCGEDRHATVLVDDANPQTDSDDYESLQTVFHLPTSKRGALGQKSDPVLTVSIGGETYYIVHVGKDEAGFIPVTVNRHAEAVQYAYYFSHHGETVVVDSNGAPTVSVIAVVMLSDPSTEDENGRKIVNEGTVRFKESDSGALKNTGRLTIREQRYSIEAIGDPHDGMVEVSVRQAFRETKTVSGMKGAF